jgi:hypothetical protein
MLRTVMRRVGHAAVAGALLGVSLAGPGLALPSAQAASTRAALPSAPAGSGFALAAGTGHACPASATPGVAGCSALVSTTPSAAPRLGVQAAAAAPAGYSPANLQAAYGLQSNTEGMRQTVAVVVPFDDPTAAADLSIYRAQYGLTPCTTANGCFTKVDLASSPTNNAGWTAEAQIDMDVVSAVCPNCHILLAEATASDMPDLGAAVQAAVADGAHVVDFTPTTPEFSGETSDDAYFDQPGVAVVTAAGDSGYGVSYPAASPYVTAVGGTVLTASSSVARGWTETAWPGTGSGCSAYEPQPSWQASLGTGCTGRMDNDVSAVAASSSSATPVAYYDSFDTDGWSEAGGTAVASSVIAAVYALAGTPAAASDPASYPYSFPDLLNDVTSGSNGTCSVASWCTAGTNYDGPTGEGTPGAVVPFTATGKLSGAIYNGSADICMDNANNSTTNGNKVQIWSCLGDAAQQWTVEASGKIETGNGMCLGVDGGSGAAAGAKVWTWNCASGGAKWLPDYPQRLTDGTLCLGINNSGSGGNGTQLWVNTCDTDAAQQWTLPYPVPTSTGEIQPQASSAVCIGQVTSSSTLAAALFGCDANGNQTWTVEADGTIKAASGDCLDVHDAGTANGTEVDYAGCNSDAAQQWRINADGSLHNPESGKCIEPSGGSDTSGTTLVLETCTYTAIQEWTLPALPS